MVRELGAGTLDQSPFRYWVRQDYVFLIEYCGELAQVIVDEIDRDDHKFGSFPPIAQR